MKGLNAQEERRLKIKGIIESIKEVYASGGDIDKDLFIFEIQQRHGCTEQKAKDYFDSAMKAHEWDIKQRINAAQND